MSELETYLRGKSLGLNDNDFTILRNQDIDGLSFVKLTYERFVDIPLKISAGKATKLATVIEELNNQSLLMYTKETADQIKFLYEHFKSESESASLSTINGDLFQRFLDFSKLAMKFERFGGEYPSEDVDPYKWNSHAENHKSQIELIINYLNTHLKPILPDEIVIEDVANKKGFLKVHKNSTMPFDINCGTDIILVEEQCVMGKALKAGIHAIFELKKEVEERHIYQTVLEMVIADCYVSNVKVFGVLTDLKEVWNIFWLTVNKKIAMVCLKNRKTAFEAINKMVRSDNPTIEGISNTERVKYMDYFDEMIDIPSDDIAPMDDFVEEMDESEVLMHKTKKVINALKYNPIFSSILASPPNNPTFPSMLESLPSSFSEF